MKKTLFLAICFLMAMTNVSLAQIKLNLEKGEKYSYVSTVEIESLVTVQGQIIEGRNFVESDYTISLKENEADGNTILNYQLDKVKFSITQMGQEQKYSTEEGVEDNTPMIEQMYGGKIKKLTKEPIIVKLDPKGEVLELTAPEDIDDAILQMVQISKESLSKEFAYLTTEELSKNKGYKTSMEMNSMNMDLTVDSDFTPISIKKSKIVENVKTTLYEMNDGKKEKLGEFLGELTINAKNGLIKEYTVDGEFDIEVTQQGMTLPVNIKQRAFIKMK